MTEKEYLQAVDKLEELLMIAELRAFYGIEVEEGATAND